MKKSGVLVTCALFIGMTAPALAQPLSLEQLSQLMAVQQSEITKLREDLKTTKDSLKQAIAANQTALNQSIASVQSQFNTSETALASRVTTLEAKVPTFANGKVIFYTGALFYTLEYNTANGTWLYKNNLTFPIGPFPRF